MKTLMVLFVAVLIKGDKLDRLYLPPDGANYAGGSHDDIEVPLEPYEEIYLNNNKSLNITSNDLEPNKLRSGPKSTNVPSSGNDFYGLSTSTYPKSSLLEEETRKDVFDKPFGQADDTMKKFQESNKYIDRDNDLNVLPIRVYSPKNILMQTNTTNKSRITPNALEFGDKTQHLVPTSYNNPSSISILNDQSVSSKITDFEKPKTYRPQADADRSAIVINYENIISPDGFSYTFDTSNGIHADESGTTADGVKAHGSYSYIGDDGKLYNITYTADENGFRPQGDHLPTPPPIPDAILKVIEQANKDRIKGIYDDGLYDENKYGHKKYSTKYDSKNNNYPLETLVSKQRNSNRFDLQPENKKNNINIEESNIAKVPTTSDGYNIHFNAGTPHSKLLPGKQRNQQQSNSVKISNSSLEDKFGPQSKIISEQDSLIPKYEDKQSGYEYFPPGNKFTPIFDRAQELSDSFVNYDGPHLNEQLIPKKDNNSNLRNINEGYINNINRKNDPHNIAVNSIQDTSESRNKHITNEEKFKIPKLDSQFGEKITISNREDDSLPFSSSTPRLDQYFYNIDATTGKPRFSMTYKSAYSVTPEAFDEYNPAEMSTTNLQPSEVFNSIKNDYTKAINKLPSTSSSFTTESASSAIYSTSNPKEYTFYSGDTYPKRPSTISYSPSTERIMGEDFAGPKQDQRFDPQTGYYY